MYYYILPRKVKIRDTGNIDMKMYFGKSSFKTSGMIGYTAMEPKRNSFANEIYFHGNRKLAEFDIKPNTALVKASIWGGVIIRWFNHRAIFSTSGRDRLNLSLLLPVFFSILGIFTQKLGSTY